MVSTRWSPKRSFRDDSLPKLHLEANATYQWQPLQRYSTMHCMQAPESAGLLEVSWYNYLWRCSLDRCQLMRRYYRQFLRHIWSMITKGYDKCCLKKVASMPWQQQILYPHGSDNALHQKTRATGMIILGAWFRKSRYGDWITFECIHHSCLLFVIGSRPSTQGVGLGLENLPFTVEYSRYVGSTGWSLLNCLNTMCDIWFTMSTYVGERWNCSVPFLSLPLVWCMQPRRSVPDGVDNVMAACHPGPGKDHSM